MAQFDDGLERLVNHSMFNSPLAYIILLVILVHAVAVVGWVIQACFQETDDGLLYFLLKFVWVVMCASESQKSIAARKGSKAQ